MGRRRAPLQLEASALNDAAEMGEFLEAAFTMPTTVFSVGLIIVSVYWSMVLLGALDIDVLQGPDDIGGGLDGGHIDIGHADIGDSGDVGDGHDGDGSFLSTLGISGVPLTISLSVIILLGWFFCFTGTYLLGRDSFWILLAVAIFSTIFALFGASLLARPLSKMFDVHLAMERRQVVGRVGILVTQRVDGSFGQVEVRDDEGAVLLIQARSKQVNELKKGSSCIIYEYDADHEVFWVSPLSPNYTTFLEWKKSLPSVLRD